MATPEVEAARSTHVARFRRRATHLGQILPKAPWVPKTRTGPKFKVGRLAKEILIRYRETLDAYSNLLVF